MMMCRLRVLSLSHVTSQQSLRPLAVRGERLPLPSVLPSEGPAIQRLFVAVLQHASAGEAALSSVGQAVPFDGFPPGARRGFGLAPGEVLL